MSSTPKPPASPREFLPRCSTSAPWKASTACRAPVSGARSSPPAARPGHSGQSRLPATRRAARSGVLGGAPDLGTPASLDCLPRASHHAGPELPPLSPRLYSADLAPTKAEGRRWGRYSLFALWTNDVHNIANYSFAIGLFALGMSGAQILAALALGALMVYGLMNLSGYMGQKTGLLLPGDVPHRLRHPRRATPRADPRGDRHRLVRHPDLSRLHRPARAADGDLAGLAAYDQTPSSACRAWAGRPSSPSGACNC